MRVSPGSCIIVALAPLACGGDDSSLPSSGSSSTGAGDTTSSSTNGGLDDTGGPDTPDGEESTTTGPQPCGSSVDCVDAAAPFCNPLGECVACDGMDDPDAACLGADETMPVCAGGACVACTEGNTTICDDQLLLCDTGTNACVPCTRHDQCEVGACELAVGRCFPGEATVRHVDGDGGLDATNISTALEGIDADGYGVIVVHDFGPEGRPPTKES